jgi:hypothetical protein
MMKKKPLFQNHIKSVYIFLCCVAVYQYLFLISIINSRSGACMVAINIKLEITYDIVEFEDTKGVIRICKSDRQLADMEHARITEYRENVHTMVGISRLTENNNYNS